MIYGCTTQSPAPIEYNYEQYFTKRSTDTNSSFIRYAENKELIEHDQGEIINRKIDDKKKYFNAPTSFLKNYNTAGNKNQKDIIVVPKIKQNDSKLIYHTVQHGETLTSIANTYGKKVEELAELNDISIPYHINESQIITIKITTELLNKKNRENTVRKIKNVVQANTSEFIKPIEGKIITKFGAHTSEGISNGINIAANEGTAVKSIATGQIIFAGNDTRFGNLLIVKLDNSDLYIAYAHLQDLIFQKNTIVPQGKVIGHVGNTGNVTYSQLHFAIRKGKIAVDPLNYINF